MSITLDDSAHQWFQFVVTDEEGLSGSSVARFVQSLLVHKNIKFVVCDDIVGSVHGLSNLQMMILPVERFVAEVSLATQYDWAFFFMYEFEPDARLFKAESFIGAALNSATITVRLVDDYYFYVYFRDEDVANELLTGYPSGILESLTQGVAQVPF